MTQSILAIVSGIFSSGKTTLTDKLVNDYGMERCITATTRPPRKGEVDGVHYHFMEPKKFKEGVKRGDFLEATNIHGESDYRLYGTPRAPVINALENGKSLILNIDVQGHAKIRADKDDRIRSAIISFFLIVSEQEIVRRARIRGDMTDKEIEIRLKTAREEIKAAKDYHHRLSNPPGGIDSLAWKVRYLIDRRLIEQSCFR